MDLSNIMSALQQQSQVNRSRTYQPYEDFAVNIEPSLNTVHLHCPRCKEIIIQPNQCSFEKVSHPFPSDTSPQSHEGNGSNTLTNSHDLSITPSIQDVELWWVVPTIMHFDNITVSKSLRNLQSNLSTFDDVDRFLTCGACEVPTLGFVSRDGKIRISCERVMYRVTP